MLVIQNDVGNKHSPTVICAAITSRMNKAKLPTHVELSARDCDMVKDSVILFRTASDHRQAEAQGKDLPYRRGAVRPGGRGAEGQLGTWRLLGKCL